MVKKGRRNEDRDLCVTIRKGNRETQKEREMARNFGWFWSDFVDENEYVACRMYVHDLKEIFFLNPFHKTPLHYAVMKGQKDCIEILLQNGADVNVIDVRI